MTNVKVVPQVKVSPNVDNNTRLNEQGQVITKEQLVEILKNANFNSKLISFVYFGDYAKSRTKNGLKMLKKASYNRVFVGHNYQDKVNARLLKVANEKGIDFKTFKAQKANGLEKISDLLYINKKGQYRLRGYHGHENVNGVERASKTKTLGYFKSVTFERVTEEQATNENLFTPSHFKKDDYKAGRGSLVEQNNFRVNNYSIENIAKIVIEGNVYEIR